MRTKARRGEACGGRTPRVRVAHGEEDDPDRRGPPVGGRGEGAPIWAERGKWAGGREEFGPREKKKRKGEGGGLKTRGGKRKDFAFLKLNQTIQFKLKFREFKFEPNNKQ